MSQLIRNYTAGEFIPDANNDGHYSFEELDRAVRVAQDEITGAETYILTNNKIAVLQSVDLDWVDDGSHLLRTTSASPRAELISLLEEANKQSLFWQEKAWDLSQELARFDHIGLPPVPAK